MEPLKNEAERYTPGVMRCRYEVLGGHIHCAIYGPFSGKAGDLIVRIDEWAHFQTIHPHWQFAPKETS